MHWICSQIGSREHYAIPRILHARGELSHFLTDFWGKDFPYLRGMPVQALKKMGERWHPDMASAQVTHLGISRLIFELQARLKKERAWDLILRRNRWYQQKILARASANLKRQEPGIFFSYSYSALDLATWFHRHNWKIVIGQIDPGKLEEDMVATEENNFPEFKSLQKRAPSSYWEGWRKEMALATVILVNSEWSKEALLRQGFDESKIEIVPLAYGALTEKFTRVPIPEKFSSARPLRVLFLGQVNLRKGAHYLLKAMGELENLPVTLDFVGPNYMEMPPDYLREGVKFHGPVSRTTAENFYAQADVFILPTLSDGFAITQLEALGKNLPLIVSQNCARIIHHRHNGYLLEEINQKSITEALKYCLYNPRELERWIKNCEVPEGYSMSALDRKLSEIAGKL